MPTTSDHTPAKRRTKKFMLLSRKPPHGGIYAQEALEVALIAGAFGQDVSMAFIDDGVYQLVKQQDTRSIGTKNFSRGFRALEDFEVNKLVVELESLRARGLDSEDLIVTVQTVTAPALGEMMAQQDVLLSF